MEKRYEGRGGRTDYEGRIVRGQFARMQICGRGLPIRLCKGGDLVIKEREANTRRGMQISRCKGRSRRQRRYPYTIMQPNNANDRCVCAEVFSKKPQPQGFRVFQSVEGAISISDSLKGASAKQGIKTFKNLRFGPTDGAQRVKYLHGRVVTILTIRGERVFKSSIEKMSR